MQRISAVVLVVLASLFLAACDTGEDITLDQQVPAEVRDAVQTDDNGEDGNGEAAEGDSYTWEAFDLGFDGPTQIEAGTVTIVMDNTGNLPHDITIEELGETVAEGDGGETDQGTVTLEPGTYTFYCSVPGHRASMEMEVEAT